MERESITIGMDGKGRAIDNVMIERLWRTVKYENIYLKEYTTGTDCHQHGRQRPSDRQRDDRAALANGEVREHLPQGVHDGSRLS